MSIVLADVDMGAAARSSLVKIEDGLKALELFSIRRYGIGGSLVTARELGMPPTLDELLHM